MKKSFKKRSPLPLLVLLIGTIPLEAAARIWPKDPFQSKAPLYNPLSMTLPDSIAPTENAADTEPTPRLQGIVKIENRYRAMINDTIRREGEKVGPYRVQNIGADHVTLRDDDGHIFRLEFEQ
jgi:hypothetical protein